LTATWIALLVDPTQELNLTLRQGMLDSGARNVISAHSVDEVDEIVDHQANAGELAVVSGRFEADTGPIVQTLLQVGWDRVLIFKPVGDTEPEAFDTGATGLLSWPTVYAQFDPPRFTRDLTQREREVLSLVAAGLSTRQIAAELRLSTTSIRGDLTRISKVIGTGNRCHMVLIALRAGVL
jgi:DNA-binding CsgD family transcriptional regulator